MKQYEVLKPECYSRFACKCGDCRFSCCQEWSITMNKEDCKAVQQKDKEAVSFIRPMENNNPVAPTNYTLNLKEDGYCPYFEENGLCGLQLKNGAEVLPTICRVYPRIFHKYLNKVEGGLSLGCEKVLELLFEERDGIIFSNKTEFIPDKMLLSSNVTGKLRLKYPALPYYYDIQSLCFGILQAEDAAMEDRLILLGIALFRIDEMAGNGKENDIPTYITRYLNSMDSIDAIEQLQTSMLQKMKNIS